ncbi:sortase domain-containing protein [Streptomyces stackebrandtii]|uniref:class E sortase n=1 Tax=Streptomyces stackebrandtii TaxID=3051177 RepID=UPI0037DA6BC0
MGAKRGGSFRREPPRGRGFRWALGAVVAAVIAIVTVLAGCAGGSGTTTPPGTSSTPGTSRNPSTPSTSSTSTGAHGPTSQVPAATATAPPTPPAPRGPVDAEMSIPSIGVEDLDVVPYEGTTDDRAGTRIQDRGVAASPYGERGGVGPGEVGNYLVTAHRLSAGGPLRELPSVEVGDQVHVTAEGTVYTYEIVETRTTSFRSARSLAEQRAAVPGEPDEKPTRAMITLSTCATPEDNAAGNFWRDAQNNPEHRIDKIGVLTSTRTA